MKHWEIYIHFYDMIFDFLTSKLTLVNQFRFNRFIKIIFDVILLWIWKYKGKQYFFLNIFGQKLNESERKRYRLATCNIVISLPHSPPQYEANSIISLWIDDLFHNYSFIFEGKRLWIVTGEFFLISFRIKFWRIWFPPPLKYDFSLFFLCFTI